MRLIDPNAASGEVAQGRLGFKRCQRGAIELPDGARAAAAGLVLVESGSRLSRGTLISSDGLVLAPASGWSRLLPSQRVRASGRLMPPSRRDLTVAALSVRRAPVRVDPPGPAEEGVQVGQGRRVRQPQLAHPARRRRNAIGSSCQPSSTARSRAVIRRGRFWSSWYTTIVVAARA